MDDNLPVIVGVGQVTQRPGTERPREPLALIAEACRNAEADIGAGGLLHPAHRRVVGAAPDACSDASFASSRRSRDRSV